MLFSVLFSIVREKVIDVCHFLFVGNNHLNATFVFRCDGTPGCSSHGSPRAEVTTDQCRYYYATVPLGNIWVEFLGLEGYIVLVAAK